jgi:hypothetical protein
MLCQYVGWTHGRSGGVLAQRLIGRTRCRQDPVSRDYDLERKGAEKRNDSQVVFYDKLEGGRRKLESRDVNRTDMDRFLLHLFLRVSRLASLARRH